MWFTSNVWFADYYIEVEFTRRTLLESVCKFPSLSKKKKKFTILFFNLTIDFFNWSMLGSYVPRLIMFMPGKILNVTTYSLINFKVTTFSVLELSFHFILIDFFFNLEKYRVLGKFYVGLFFFCFVCNFTNLDDIKMKNENWGT